MVSTLFTALALIATGQVQVPPAPPEVASRSGPVRSSVSKSVDRRKRPV